MPNSNDAAPGTTHHGISCFQLSKKVTFRSFYLIVVFNLELADENEMLIEDEASSPTVTSPIFNTVESRAHSSSISQCQYCSIILLFCTFCFSSVIQSV